MSFAAALPMVMMPMSGTESRSDAARSSNCRSDDSGDDDTTDSRIASVRWRLLVRTMCAGVSDGRPVSPRACRRASGAIPPPASAIALPMSYGRVAGR